MTATLPKLCLLAALFSAMSQAQDVTGDWLGTLKTQGPEFRFALHITKSASGALSGDFDSIDQDTHLPVSSIAFKGETLKFTIDQSHAVYEGTINADSSVISGTWTQGQSFPLDFRRGIAKSSKTAKPSDIDGAWSGLLDFGVQKLHIVFHIVSKEDGLSATSDSPDQGVKGVGVTAIRNGNALKLEMKSASAAFEGKIASDRKSITGTFSQGASTVPLVLTPLQEGASTGPRRPQNPLRPYPYREEEVSFDNTAQSIRLAGTLTLPQGKGPFPGVVLITGSGPQDRDETIAGHKPFLVLADHLTRKGIAVLRVDDRGTGRSTGNFAKATTADFATDTEAGLAFLKKRPEVNPHKLGLIGHSEGGVIAPMVAARNHDVNFIVMLAGSGVRGNELIIAQTAGLLLASGKTQADADKAASQEREILQLAESDKPDKALADKLRELSGGRATIDQIDTQVEQLRSRWYLYFLRYDPTDALSKITCPALVLNGDKDTQVPASQNLPAIRKAFEESGNKRVEIVELPGLNHLFQTAKTGLPSEYSEIEETFSPVALEKISSWILKL